MRRPARRGDELPGLHRRGQWRSRALAGRGRIPLGDGADAVWFICDQHKVRWREDYRRESWTPELSNDDERAPHERGWTLGQLCEHRTHLLSRYREVEPYNEAKRHLVEIPERFAVARWSRDADVATICRCILGTVKYEPHAADVKARHCGSRSRA